MVVDSNFASGGGFSRQVVDMIDCCFSSIFYSFLHNVFLPDEFSRCKIDELKIVDQLVSLELLKKDKDKVEEAMLTHQVRPPTATWIRGDCTTRF